MNERRRVLVASGDRTTRTDMCRCLAEFHTTEATDPITTAALSAACRPEVIVLDARDAETAACAAAGLRKDFRTTLTPILYIVDEGPDAIGASLQGADDYVVMPFSGHLTQRVTFSLRRSAALRGVNPLSGLPGNAVVGEEIVRRLAEGTRFACLYIDLDNFKAFNDRFGFARGDDLIRAVARCIVRALEPQIAGECFAGHVGGDDFVVLTPAEAARDVASAITRCFDELVRGVGDGGDPRCSMSIGIVSTGPDVRGAAQLGELAAEIKSIAKRRAGSTWAARSR